MIATLSAGDKTTVYANFSPLAINTFFLLVPLLIIFTVLPFSIIASIHNHRASIYLAQLDELFLQGSLSLRPNGAPFDPSVIPPLVTLLKEEGVKTLANIVNVQICWASLVGFELIVRPPPLFSLSLRSS